MRYGPNFYSLLWRWTHSIKSVCIKVAEIGDGMRHGSIIIICKTSARARYTAFGVHIGKFWENVKAIEMFFSFVFFVFFAIAKLIAFCNFFQWDDGVEFVCMGIRSGYGEVSLFWMPKFCNRKKLIKWHRMLSLNSRDCDVKFHGWVRNVVQMNQI